VESIAPSGDDRRTFRPDRTTRAGLNNRERSDLIWELRAYFRWVESGVDPWFAPELGAHCEEDRAEHERVLMAIHEFMLQLSPTLRELARLKTVERFSNSKVAARFGMGSADIYKKQWQRLAPQILVVAMSAENPEGWPLHPEHRAEGWRGPLWWPGASPPSVM
jgi:hypothetical protein